VGFCVVVYTGIWMVQDGALSGGTLFAFLAGLYACSRNVRSLVTTYHQLQEARAGVHRVFGVLALQPTVVSPAEPRSLPGGPLDVALEGVSVSYVPGSWALRDVSARIPAGSFTALVGFSGAGKTTLLGLLLRHYDPAAGRVLLGGENLSGLSLSDVREAVALAAQRAVLFTGSIRSNLRMARPEASDEELWEALRLAGLDEFTRSMPGALDAEVGPRAEQLSAGEAQRLSLARTLLRKPRVLLLDEALSNVDAVVEGAILTRIREAFAEAVVIIVTHRMAATAHADSVLVLDGGKLIETGSPRELLDRSGVFKQLCDLQARSGAETEHSFPRLLGEESPAAR
jgi:ABC-type multidrug transport system fused ATPase/permease subunit